MTDRIHYHFAKRALEAGLGRKVTPFEMMEESAKVAEFVANDAIRKGNHPNEEISFNFHCALIQFGLHGRQCFELGPELTEAFKRADLSNIKAKHIRVPFEAFWISFPPGTAKLWGGKRTGWHDVWGTYVCLSHLAEGELAFLPYAGASEFSIHDQDDSTSWITFDLTKMEELDNTIEDHLSDIFENTPSFAPWNYLDDGTFDKSQGGNEPFNPLASISNVTGADSFIKPGMPAPSNKQLREHQDSTFRDIIRIAVNTMLYLTSPKAEIDVDQRGERDCRAIDLLCRDEKKLKPSKRRKLATKVSKKRCTRLTRLGAGLEQLLKERAGCWVRAHWQIYWTGEGRTTPTPIFKLPFPSGIIDPNEETRQYIVEKED
jgi:hypothetical protein